MVSYEKIRQSLCSWTLFIAWVNVLAVLAKILLLSATSRYLIILTPLKVLMMPILTKQSWQLQMSGTLLS